MKQRLYLYSHGSTEISRKLPEPFRQNFGNIETQVNNKGTRFLVCDREQSRGGLLLFCVNEKIA